jgi:signal transduction histidine kinase
MATDPHTDRLSDFLSVSPDIFWEMDTSGILTFLSMQISSLVDRPIDDFIGKPLTNLFEDKSCHAEWTLWVQSCLKGKLAPLEMLALPLDQDRTVYVAAYAQRFARGLRGYIRDITESVLSDMNAQDIEQQLADTIEAVPYGIALYDKRDELVFINSKNRDLFPGITDLMQPGTSFETLVRRFFEENLQKVPEKVREQYIAKRLALHRNNYGQREVLLADDRWVEISEHMTPEGNVVVSWSDITTQKRREMALSSLLNDPQQQTLSVPERAAKAVALALGCRWGAVARLDGSISSQKANIIALWDNDGFMQPFGYSYIGTPCEKIYQQGGYIHLPHETHYNFPNLIKEHTMMRYHGMALRDQNGGLIGHVFALDDKVGEVEYYHGREIFQLIGNWVETEFRRQELNQSIADAHKRFRDFAEVASDWFWEMNADYSFKFISEHTPESVRERLQLLVQDAHIQNETDYTLARDKTPVSAFRDVEVTVFDHDAQEELAFRVSARPVFDEQGRHTGYRGTGTDVTEMMKANQRAARAESWLLEAIESSPEAFALYDKDDRLQIHNQKFLELFFPEDPDSVTAGMTFSVLQDLFLTQSISQVPKDDIESWKQERMLQRGIADPGAHNEIYISGRTYIVVEHRTSEGGIASFYIDITQLHEQEKSLLRAKEQAETASRSKSDFLANISHELRTPLNAIIGFSELIRDELAGPPNSPKYKEYIGDIHNSGMHLMELINDILDLSKAEAGMIEGSNRNVDISDITEACVKLMRPKAERAYVKLSATYPEDLPLLWVDPKHIRQILLNLVSNSVKFTPEGGSVDVRLVLDDQGLSLIVKDTGIGMNPEDVPKAMAPFGQIDSSLARKYNGTGLGLPLTKRLMDYYEGDMVIQTAPNKGTSVKITFGKERFRYPEKSNPLKSNTKVG